MGTVGLSNGRGYGDLTLVKPHRARRDRGNALGIAADSVDRAQVVLRFIRLVGEALGRAK